MRRKKNTRIIAYIMIFTVSIACFVQCPIDVCAKTKVYHTWEEFREDATVFLLTLAAEVGAVCIDHDAVKFIENYKAFNDYFSEDHIQVDYESQSVKVDAEFMTWFKAAIQEYAAQNEPYKIMTSYVMSDILSEGYEQKNIYDSIKNLVNIYPNGEIYFGKDPRTYNGVKGCVLTVLEFEHPQEVACVATATNQYFYNQPNVYSWKTWEYLSNKAAVYRVFLTPEDDAIQSLQEIKDKAYENANENNYWSYYYREYDGSRSSSVYNINNVTLRLRAQDGSTVDGIFSIGTLITSVRKHIRVYTTVDDMMDYTINRRKIYYTSDWYNKKPTEITVDLTEIEDRLDDMDEVIRQLLEQISDNESEDRIEELLQQILDAINGMDPGGSTGGSSGGGTVVEYDDTTLRAQLSVYFAQVISYLKQIASKISSGLTTGEISFPENLNDKLEEILDQLKAIKRWTAADAVANGADAVADWLSYINDLMSDTESGTDAIIGALSTAFTDTVGLFKAKFPFSLPWDVIAIVEVMAAEPETPVFVLPLHIDSLSYNYDFVIDMTDYEIISKISRTFLSLLYALGLIKLSGKFIEIKKGG